MPVLTDLVPETYGVSLHVLQKRQRRLCRFCKRHLQTRSFRSLVIAARGAHPAASNDRYRVATHHRRSQMQELQKRSTGHGPLQPLQKGST